MTHAQQGYRDGKRAYENGSLTPADAYQWTGVTTEYRMNWLAGWHDAKDAEDAYLELFMECGESGPDEYDPTFGL